MDRKELIRNVLRFRNRWLFDWIKEYLIRVVDLNFRHEYMLSCGDVSMYLEGVMSECMIAIWEILPDVMKNRDVGEIVYSEADWPEYYREHKACKIIFGKKTTPDSFGEIVLELLENYADVLNCSNSELIETGRDILLELIKRKLLFFIYTT